MREVPMLLYMETQMDAGMETKPIIEEGMWDKCDWSHRSNTQIDIPIPQVVSNLIYEYIHTYWFILTRNEWEESTCDNFCSTWEGWLLSEINY